MNLIKVIYALKDVSLLRGELRGHLYFKESFWERIR
jgi:hypothetical protein